jgi:hypothetical protein
MRIVSLLTRFGPKSMARWIGGSLVLSAASLPAANPCPVRQPGQAYPWSRSADLMPGDEWAYLYIDVDTKGRPSNCRVGKHQYQPETGFWMCRAMMAQANFEPIMKDGIAIAGTVTRYTMIPGRQRQREDEAARKQFFRDHPDERPSCYPD